MLFKNCTNTEPEPQLEPHPQPQLTWFDLRTLTLEKYDGQEGASDFRLQR